MYCSLMVFSRCKYEKTFVNFCMVLFRYIMALYVSWILHIVCKELSKQPNHCYSLGWGCHWPSSHNALWWLQGKGCSCVPWGSFPPALYAEPSPLFYSSLLSPLFLCLWTQSEGTKEIGRAREQQRVNKGLKSKYIALLGQGVRQKTNQRKGDHQEMVDRRNKEKEKKLKFCPITAGAEA